MNFWTLILLLGTSFPHWTTETSVTSVTYELSHGILKNVTPGHANSINLIDLGIKSIAVNSLDALEKVKSFDLSYNPITELPPFIFSKLKNLKKLSLAHTRISSFNNAFVGLTKLSILDLTGAPITSLIRGDLFGLMKDVTIMITSRRCMESAPRLAWISTGIFKAPSINVPASTESTENKEIPMNQNSEQDKSTLKYALKICITDGIVESVEDAQWDDNPGNCTLQKEGLFGYRKREMMMYSVGRIRGFKAKWYRIKDSYFNEISIRSYIIDDVSPEIFNNLPPKITKINLSFNGLTAIKNNGLKNDHPITLNLQYNKISKIENGAFEKLNLVTLDLEHNNVISTAFAKTLPVIIKILSLKLNKIREVPLDSFHRLKNLKVLDIMDNQISNIEPGTFRNLENLTLVILKNNRIGELKPGLFQGLDKLQIIDLSFNQIKKIPNNLFEKWNPPPTKFNLLLDRNEIAIIEDNAFSEMNINILGLRDNQFRDNSIGGGIFNGSHISGIFLGSRILTKFNGDWFRGVSGLEKIELSSYSVKRIERGLAKFMMNVTTLFLEAPELEILQNGALFGLSRKKDVKVFLNMQSLRLIEGGLFDDL